MKIKKFDLFFFVYFLTGIITYKIYVDIGNDYSKESLFNIIVIFYLYSFYIFSLIYLISVCFFVKHRHILMNIIDGILCYILTCLLPSPVLTYIYEYNMLLYYILSGIYIILPIVFNYIDKEELDINNVLKVVTRLLMIIFTLFTIFILNSCSVDIRG